MKKKTEIIKVKGSWTEVMNDCRATVGKHALAKEPSEEFKKALVIAEHSPIRDIIFKWKWAGIPHWVGVHYVRHKWECFVRTQREDRTGTPRSELTQVEPQDFTGEANTQHLIDTARKRLCYRAARETREYMEDLKRTIRVVEPEIADALVPNCVYRCGCPEVNSCNWFDAISRPTPEFRSTNIQERYDAYNMWFSLADDEEKYDSGN